MKVEASALGVSSLIRALMEASELHGDLQDALQPMGLDLDWLGAVGERYRSFWFQTYPYVDLGDRPVVCEHTTMLLSWLLAGCRDPDVSSALGTAADAFSTETYDSVFGSPELPPSERVNLTLGIVGRPIATIDRDYPAYFAGGLVDPDVESAYSGLLDHVARAGTRDWPEMHRTAVLWRLGGIAQGLTGGDEDLLPCMQRLNSRLVGSLPTRYRRLTTNEWLTEYRKSRNVLTHVRPVGDVSFSGVVREHEDVTDLLDYLRLATIYVAAAISERLAGLELATVGSWVNIVDDDQSWVALV